MPVLNLTEQEAMDMHAVWSNVQDNTVDDGELGESIQSIMDKLNRIKYAEKGEGTEP